MTVETPMPNFATIEAAGRLDEFYDRLKMVKQACDAMTKGLALHVNIRNGELATTGGMFKLINIEKKTLDPVKSWDTIAEHLSTTEIAECTSISLPKVLKAVGKKAEPGQGVKVKKALTDQLDAAGAIQWSGYTKMDYRKTVKNKQE